MYTPNRQPAANFFSQPKLLFAQESAAQESAAQESATQQTLKLRIFDQTITINTTDIRLHSLFGQMYQRFLHPPLLAEEDHRVTAVVEQQNSEDKQAAQAGNRLSIFDVSRLLKTYVTQVRSHLLCHAGVLSYAGQGILLVAPSMHGKTTLTLKLVRDGFDFLSDDIAAIGLEDGLVHPFPRAFVIRSGSLALAGFSQQPPETPTWLGKQIIDAETLRPNCMGKAVPIRHIFFLHDEFLVDTANLTAGSSQDNQIVNSFELLLPTLPADLESALQTVAGVEQITIAAVDGHVRLEVLAQNRPRAIQEIDALCQTHNVDPIYLDDRALHRPTFDSPAQLTELSHSCAVIELLEQFLGGYHSALFQHEMCNSPIQLSMTLARIIQNANCYKLKIGPLQEMADLVRQTVADPQN